MENVLLISQMLHFAAAMILGGGAMLFPTLTGRTIPCPAAALLLAMAVASSIVWLAALAVLFTGDAQAYADPATLSSVIFGTQFGAVWRWRMGIALLLALTLVGWKHRVCRIAFNTIAIAYLASLAITGHAVGDTGMLGRLHEANQALHLLAAGTWIGGLAVLLSQLRAHPEKSPEQMLQRFSGIGYAAVAVVLSTGIINIRLIVRSVAGLTAGEYGLALLIKIGLVLAMLALAAANRFALTPGLARAPDVGIQRLRLSIALEFGLGLATIAAAASLGSQPPPG